MHPMTAFKTGAEGIAALGQTAAQMYSQIMQG